MSGRQDWIVSIADPAEETRQVFGPYAREKALAIRNQFNVVKAFKEQGLEASARRLEKPTGHALVQRYMGRWESWPPIEERELREILATIYQAEGVDIWVADAKQKNWTVDYAKQRAAQLQDGAYA
jgi:hypothetical protein